MGTFYGAKSPGIVARFVCPRTVTPRHLLTVWTFWRLFAAPTPRGSRSRRARRASRQARRRSRRGWRRALATVRGSSCVPWVEISSVFRSKRARRRWISQPVSRVPGRGPCCRGQEQMKPSLSAEQPYDSSEPSGGETHGGGRDGRDGKGRGALLRAAQGRLPLVFGRPTSPS